MRGRDKPVTVRAYVQQDVAASSDHVDKHADDVIP